MAERRGPWSKTLQERRLPSPLPCWDRELCSSEKQKVPEKQASEDDRRKPQRERGRKKERERNKLGAKSRMRKANVW